MTLWLKSEPQGPSLFEENTPCVSKCSGFPELARRGLENLSRPSLAALGVFGTFEITQIRQADWAANGFDMKLQIARQAVTQSAFNEGCPNGAWRTTQSQSTPDFANRVGSLVSLRQQSHQSVPELIVPAKGRFNQSTAI